MVFNFGDSIGTGVWNCVGHLSEGKCQWKEKRLSHGCECGSIPCGSIL